MTDWSTVEVAGKPCDVFEPAAPNPNGYVLIYLHDADARTPASSAALTAQFQQHGLPVIAPVTGHSWWGERIAADFDQRLSPKAHVLNVVAWVREHWATDSPRIGLTGVGMGGQGALRLSFQHPSVFPIVAAISPAIDYHLLLKQGDETLAAMYPDVEAARQETAILYVNPLNWPRNLWFCCDPADPWFESADRLRMKLFAMGIPHDCDLETSAGGHPQEYLNRMAPAAVNFLVERLDRERLRLV